MGLLDDLKQQADTLRQKEQVSQEEISQNLLLAHAKLKDALHYWVELFNSLNVIKPTISRVYYLEGGATRLDDLRPLRRRRLAGEDGDPQVPQGIRGSHPVGPQERGEVTEVAGGALIGLGLQRTSVRFLF